MSPEGASEPVRRWKAIGPRVSEYYKLGVGQADLPFVDVDLLGDDRLFVDPFLIRTAEDAWSAECVGLLQDYFSELLDALRTGDASRSRHLLNGLHEPNETHLGYSRNLARGRGIGRELGDRVGSALQRSAALKSGVLEDLEDTILLVPGVGRDLISDLTTNIIRGPLITATQEYAEQWSIPTAEVAATVWDNARRVWTQVRTQLPFPDIGKRRRYLLLVPRDIVRLELTFEADDYFRYHVVPFLQDLELSNPNSELIRLLKKDNTPWVAKTDVIGKYGSGKKTATAQTAEHPDILERYRRHKADISPQPASLARLASALGLPGPDFDALLTEVLAVTAGSKGAGVYHSAVYELLNALFHPDLVLPKKELKINAGRKRIDISYTNYAKDGFFGWLPSHQHVPVPNVFVECKNYEEDPQNPEVDQLAMRFSVRRGMFGMLVCRKIKNRRKFDARCADVANTDSKFIIGLDDADLKALVAARKSGDPMDVFRILKNRFDGVVM
jgi:hypothetical protein